MSQAYSKCYRECHAYSIKNYSKIITKCHIKYSLTTYECNEK